MEVLKKINIKLKSLTPLIMHSDKGCDPLHPLTIKIKEISCIMKKKAEHYKAMARLEFEIGMYYDQEVGVYMPAKCLAACFKAAAKKFKLGKASKAITIDCALGTPLIGYEGMTPEKLWDIVNIQVDPETKDKVEIRKHVFSESVVVNRARIMRTRPIFHKWEVDFDLYLNTELLSVEQLKRIIETAGFEYGLCELRPERATGIYGRFTLEDMKELK